MSPSSSTSPETTRLQSQVERLRGLIEVSSAINSVMDYDLLLSNIMEVAKRVMSAEASSLMLLDDKTNELIIRSAQGAASSEVMREIRIPAGAGIAGAVVQSGKPVNVPDVSKDPRFFGGVDKKSGFQTRAILAVPMIHQGRTIGVLEVLNPVRKSAFDVDDEESFQAYAAMATTAIERARMSEKIRNQDRIEQELGIARQIQKSFLPTRSPCDECIQTSAFYEPAREVSGDFYDFLECEKNQFGVIVADVSGKGVPAALQMARATSQIRAVSRECPSPSQLLTRVNDFLCEFPIGGIFITVICAFFNRSTGRMLLGSAGHHAPLLRRGSELLPVSLGDGIPLGILPATTYTETQIDVRKDDLLLFYTDGLLEARDARKNEFGLERAKKVMLRAPCDAAGLVENVVDSVNEFIQDAPRHDDLTLVAAKVR